MISESLLQKEYLWMKSLTLNSINISKFVECKASKDILF